MRACGSTSASSAGLGDVVSLTAGQADRQRIAERVDDEVLFEASALSFLHRQVRSMVGSLVDVGSGRWSARDLEAALKAADRSHCGQVAPASGLYLARVDYSDG